MLSTLKLTSANYWLYQDFSFCQLNPIRIGFSMSRFIDWLIVEFGSILSEKSKTSWGFSTIFRQLAAFCDAQSPNFTLMCAIIRDCLWYLTVLEWGRLALYFRSDAMRRPSYLSWCTCMRDSEMPFTLRDIVFYTPSVLIHENLIFDCFSDANSIIYIHRYQRY